MGFFAESLKELCPGGVKWRVQKNTQPEREHYRISNTQPLVAAEQAEIKQSHYRPLPNSEAIWLSHSNSKKQTQMARPISFKTALGALAELKGKKDLEGIVTSTPTPPLPPSLLFWHLFVSTSNIIVHVFSFWLCKWCGWWTV
jgi:hypothetical protein